MAEQQLDLLGPHEPDADFIVRESRRARNLAISVGAHGVVQVVVPRRTRPETVERFVNRHRAWIERAVRQMRRDRPPVDRTMPLEVALPAVGEHWTVTYDAPRLATADGVIAVPAARADRPRSRETLHRWLKRRARASFVPAIGELALRHGFSFRRVQVRGQRTRWGSYSTSGTLSLNFCLLFLTPDLVEHLMLHELCHTRETNHSRRYWRLLARLQPDYREFERRLDRAWIDVPGWVGLH